MSVDSREKGTVDDDFPWRGNTVWVDDPRAIEQALSESEYFEENGQYGFQDENPVENDSIGVQYVSPEAGVAVTVNYRHDGANPIKAVTVEESAKGFDTVDEVSESEYSEVVGHYINDILSSSGDINDPEFKDSVEDWFQASYDESEPKIMADGSGTKMGGPMGPVSKGPDNSEISQSTSQDEGEDEIYFPFKDAMGM
jgi:hypothetical protein